MTTFAKNLNKEIINILEGYQRNYKYYIAKMSSEEFEKKTNEYGSFQMKSMIQSYYDNNKNRLTNMYKYPSRIYFEFDFNKILEQSASKSDMFIIYDINVVIETNDLLRFLKRINKLVFRMKNEVL